MSLHGGDNFVTTTWSLSTNFKSGVSEAGAIHASKTSISQAGKINLETLGIANRS